MTTITEFNFEVYTLNPETKQSGWDIKFVSVIADTKDEAKEVLKKWPLFDCIITMPFSVLRSFNGETAELDKTVKIKKGQIIEISGYFNEKYLEILFESK